MVETGRLVGPSQPAATVKSCWSQCRGAVGMYTCTHTCALSLHTSTHLSREASRGCHGPFKSWEDRVLALGWGPTSCIIGWAAPPGFGPGVTGESVEGAPRNLRLGEGGNRLGLF